jgi:3-hydroxyisobutyrate dehydrogenase-like beta-hydroxyacid dehydrogenase
VAPPANSVAVIGLGIMGEAIDRSKADLIVHSLAR